jgi:hypothetical protein
MGNKSIGKRETKKPAKQKPKAEPGRKREDAYQPGRVTPKPSDS